MKLIDNNTELLRDNLISAIHNDDKIAIAASCFSMYAFKELMEQLKGINELRFIFTSSSFIFPKEFCNRIGFFISFIFLFHCLTSFFLYIQK